METKYTALNRFRLKKHMSLAAFAKWIGLDYSVVRRTITGETEPHDYHKEVFDEFYRKHEDEILSVILEPVA